MEVTTNERGDYAIAGLTKEELECVFCHFRDWAPYQNVFDALHIPIPGGYLELVPIVEGGSMSLYYRPPDTLAFSNVAVTLIRQREISMDELTAFLHASR